MVLTKPPTENDSNLSAEAIRLIGFQAMWSALAYHEAAWDVSGFGSDHDICIIYLNSYGFEIDLI